MCEVFCPWTECQDEDEYSANPRQNRKFERREEEAIVVEAHGANALNWPLPSLWSLPGDIQGSSYTLPGAEEKWGGDALKKRMSTRGRKKKYQVMTQDERKRLTDAKTARRKHLRNVRLGRAPRAPHYS